MAQHVHKNILEKISHVVSRSIGTPVSIVIHTILFIGIFALQFIGFKLDQILLILTTAVSLEAIYLSIFIQMSVNKTSQSLEGVEEDIDEIQEDVEDIQEDVDEMQEDVEEVQGHVERTDHQMLKALIKEVQALRKELAENKKK